MFSEYLNQQARCQPPPLKLKAVVHGHCHQKAIVGMSDEVAMLGAMGLDFDLLDAGCCGMAGSFGFDKHKVELSMRIGERVLLPEVRAAAPDTLVITNGYSCREQIAQGAARGALHLAEVIEMAIERRRSGDPRLHHAERGVREAEIERGRAPSASRRQSPCTRSCSSNQTGGVCLVVVADPLTAPAARLELP